MLLGALLSLRLARSLGMVTALGGCHPVYVLLLLHHHIQMQASLSTSMDLLDYEYLGSTIRK